MQKDSSIHQPARICVTGLWHQGTVLAAGFSDIGHNVTAVVSTEQLEDFNRGRVPVHEPQLPELLTKNIAAGRLRFTSDLASGLAGAQFCFLSVDTPVNSNDEPCMESVVALAEQIGKNMSGDLTLCVTAQVPVGSCEMLRDRVHSFQNGFRCDVVYIPEFLRLGTAVDTFINADRFVIGSDDPAISEKVAEIYRRLNRPILKISLRSAEMAKHASNTFLATSISFINEMSDICERVSADAVEVAAAMKLDRRIGPHAFLSPGLGFAGGTLGRDIRAIQELGRETRVRTPMMDAVMVVNGSRPECVGASLRRYYDTLTGLEIAILGLTYKTGTSTLRRAISLDIIRDLYRQGATVRAYDPLANLEEATLEERAMFVRQDDVYDAVRGVDAAVLITEWTGILETLDKARLKSAMRRPVFIDTRNFFNADEMRAFGFLYCGIGRGKQSLATASMTK